MPKLARQSYDYANYNLNVYRTDFSRNRYTKPVCTPTKKVKKRTKSKRSFLSVFVSLFILGVFLFGVIPFSYKNITKAMFSPIPYSKIKTDLDEMAFPTHKYLSNSWFMGQRDFRVELKGKKAQMSLLKEGVNMPVLESELINLTKQFPTLSPSVYVWDYNTGNYVDINADKMYSVASIIKIPVLIDVFKTIEAGQFNLEDSMNLSEYYRTEGSGSLQFKAENSEYTIDELARRMIVESDNSATNMLISKVGSMTDVNQSIRNWGLKNTEVQTWLPDYNGTNHSTAREMARMIYNIDSNDKFLSQESRAKILEYMSHVHNNRLIQAGLGSGAAFFHKTGDIGKMLGDAGIVVTPEGKKYIVVMFVNRPHNAVEGKNFIVSASDIIYKYMVK